MVKHMIIASVVWTALIFGPKSACLMAVNNKMSSPEEEVHHRGRRSVLTTHQVMVTATPFLTTSYYFNKNELITFKIRLSYNGTGTSYTNVRIGITSKWIDLSLGSVVKDMFDTGVIEGNSAVLTEATLASNQVIIANVSGVVKSTIGPLATLEFDLEVNATQGSDEILKHKATSSPTLYGVFPEVNTTRSNVDKATYVYNEIDVSMKVLLPELTASLQVELTTNIEDYVFMELKDVTINKGSGITSTKGSVTPTYHSSQVNNENDRVEMDFGNVTVASSTTDEQRTITVDYKVKVNDHQEILNNSRHYFGAGIQVGPKILWVEQYNVLVLKEEPALSFDLQVANNNGTRLYVDDIVEFTFDIKHHENTSEFDANDVQIAISTDYLTDSMLMQADGITKDKANSNDTYIVFNIDPKLSQGDSKTGTLKMKVKNDITPLLSIKADFQLLYSKIAGGTTIKKRPVTKQITSLVTATPIIDFSIKGGNTRISPGQKNTFEISISLLKMTSPLDIELVMPKAEGYPIMTVTEFKVVSVGSNVIGVDQSAKATNRSTTSITNLPDQAVLKLGHASQVTSNQDKAANKILLEFTAYMNDFDNVTDEAKYWVGAGVIGRPKMVWVGQIQVEAKVETNPTPKMAINMSYSDDTDQYQYNISFQHSDQSDQIAYNVSFEYYLPPYVEFVRDVLMPAGVTKVLGTRYKVDKEMFYFNDYVEHAIEVKLNRDNSPKSGTFDFVVPLRISYQDRIGNWREFFRAVKRSIQVLPKRPTIPVDIRAKDHYYGRGMYWNKAGDKAFYVCMNQHVPTATAACYKLHSDNQHFVAVDRRIGCVLGHANDQKLYGLARNQITVMVFDTADNDWFPLPDKELPNKTEFSYKDLTGTTSVGPMDSPAADHEETDSNNKWQGTGDGLYYKPNGGSWSLKAKWHLEN